MMKLTVYCSATDRNVQVVTAPLTLRTVLQRGVLPLESGVCLDWGRTCSGSMCPLFEVPADEMRTRLMHHGRPVPGTDVRGEEAT